MGAVVSCLGLSHEIYWEQMDHGHKYESLIPMGFEKPRGLLDEKPPTFTVLVTGMGAFPRNPGHDEDGHYSEDDNTSHLITKLLPSRLEPFSRYNSTAINIEILNPTSASGFAVKAEYGFVRQYCRELWAKHGNSVDLILHLGMADGWEWYSLERSAWKEGTVKTVDAGNEAVEYYVLPDDIGQNAKDIRGGYPWTDDIPKQLWAVPGIDVDELAQDVEHALNTEAREKAGHKIWVLPHADAGNYLCGFISYESFAQVFVNRYSAKAMFCHVPGWRDEERLGIGRDFVCTLIGKIAARQKGVVS